MCLSQLSLVVTDGGQPGAADVLIRRDGAILPLGFGVSIWHCVALGRAMPLERKGYRQKVPMF